MKPSKDVVRLDSSLEYANEAFWTAIVGEYPETNTGDIDPMLDFALATAMRNAVIGWLEVNADKPAKKKNVTVLLHNIEYSYVDGKDITDSDLETIAYQISQGISSGELYISDSHNLASGSWEINNK